MSNSIDKIWCINIINLLILIFIGTDKISKLINFIRIKKYILKKIYYKNNQFSLKTIDC